MTRMVPYTARPTLSVSPMASPRRFRIADMRCSVRSMPARLSSPNSPMREIVYRMSSDDTSDAPSGTLCSRKRASGSRPRSRTTSSSWSRSSLPANGSRMSAGSLSIRTSRSRSIFRSNSANSPCMAIYLAAKIPSVSSLSASAPFFQLRAGLVFAPYSAAASGERTAEDCFAACAVGLASTENSASALNPRVSRQTPSVGA